MTIKVKIFISSEMNALTEYVSKDTKYTTYLNFKSLENIDSKSLKNNKSDG